MLARDEVPVWWLATDTSGPDDWHRWREILDRDERERADRFWFDLDRRDFIAAHALLRSMLACYSGLAARELRFSTEADGKSKLDPGIGRPELQFNLSHTRGLVAAAVAPHGSIGIDVERIDRAKADWSVAEAFFAPEEVRLLRLVSEVDRPTWFFRLWTLKEAYIKAIGTGLGTPLDSFAFAFDPIRIKFLPHASDHAKDWYFTILQTTSQHVLSVAVGRPAGSAIQMVPREVAAQHL